MSADDIPVVVFDGEYSEVLFLKTLLESAGIEASLGAVGGGGSRLTGTSVICVRRADAEHALELVEDFRKNGKRTEPWPFGSG